MLGLIGPWRQQPDGEWNTACTQHVRQQGCPANCRRNKAIVRDYEKLRSMLELFPWGKRPMQGTLDLIGTTMVNMFTLHLQCTLMPKVDKAIHHSVRETMVASGSSVDPKRVEQPEIYQTGSHFQFQPKYRPPISNPHD